MINVPTIVDDTTKKEAVTLYASYQGRVSRLYYMIGKNQVDGSFILLYWLKLSDASDIPKNYRNWFIRPKAKQIRIPELGKSAYIAPYLIAPDVDEDELSSIIHRHSSQ